MKLLSIIAVSMLLLCQSVQSMTALKEEQPEEGKGSTTILKQEAPELTLSGHSQLLKLPVELICVGLLPYFSTPAPSNSIETPYYTIRGRDNRKDALRETSRNEANFKQYMLGVFSAHQAALPSLTDLQMNYIKDHSSEHSELIYEETQLKEGLTGFSARAMRATLIKKGILEADFKKWDQSEKNKIAIEAMKMRSSLSLMTQLFDAGAQASAEDPVTRFSLVRYAVEAENLNLLKAIIERGGDVSAPDNLDITPLMRAAATNKLKMMTALLQRKAWPNSLSRSGYSALSYAARIGSLEGIELLLAHQASVSYCSDDLEKSPLVCAVVSGSWPVVSLLLEECGKKYFDRNELDHLINVAFKKATESANKEILEKLLPKETEHKSIRPDCLLNTSTALAESIEREEFDTALQFMDYSREFTGMPTYSFARSVALGAAVRKKTNPLFACKDPSKTQQLNKVIRNLLADGADPLRITKYNSACFIAANHGDNQLVDTMIAIAVHKKLNEQSRELETQEILQDVAFRQQVQELIATQLLLEAATVGASKAVRIFLDSGANPNGCNEKKFCALHKMVAVADDTNVKVITDLIEVTDTSQVTSEGNTPLLILLMKNSSPQIKEKIARQLIEKKELLTIANNAGITPLMACAANVDSPGVDVLELLLKKGAPANARDNKGNTALILAAHHNKFLAAQLLLENGAQPNIKNNSGCGALTKSARAGNEEMIALLCRNGASMPDFKNGMLREASKHGHLKIVQELLTVHGADIDSVSSSFENTALHKAVKKHKKAVVLLLKKNKANCQIKNAKGETPIECATAGNYVDIVDILMQ